MIIAIDGPSGVGKSSTAKGVARRLGIAYLDTGAMYRAIACGFINEGVDPDNRDAIIALTRNADLRISLDPDDQGVEINGQDVTRQIREPGTSAIVSKVSTIPECRSELVARQRAIIDAAEAIIVEGRDITTVVAPDADVRLLLTANPDARVARRAAELGDAVTADDVADQVLRRDRDDSTLVNFTTAADGVVTLDSTDLTLEQVISAICELVNNG